MDIGEYDLSGYYVSNEAMELSTLSGNTLAAMPVRQEGATLTTDQSRPLTSSPTAGHSSDTSKPPVIVAVYVLTSLPSVSRVMNEQTTITNVFYTVFQNKNLAIANRSRVSCINTNHA